MSRGLTGGKIRVLLIDDDEDEFVFIRDLLGDVPSARYDVTWRSNYRSGLAALTSEEHDVCLLDFRLGEKSGLDLLAEARGRDFGFPVIFLTATTDFDLDVMAMESGAADYLVKGQLTAPLLERSLRYAIKQARDLAEIRESRAQLLRQERLASLGLLASGLAHEIGTPLGIIRSRAELAARKSAGQPAILENVTVVIQQIDRITRVIHSLLHFARGRQANPGEPVELNAVIQDVQGLLGHEFRRRGIPLRMELTADCRVKAEAGLLGQVLLNLLTNAIHAVGAAKAGSEPRSHGVRLRTERVGAQVRVSVEDTGIGVREEDQPRIFTPFFSTKPPGQGTGLGLALSANIIRSWGGSISFESAPERGSTFTVAVPVHEDALHEL